MPLLLSCRSPTQIRIEVTTDVPCDMVRGATIAVSTLDHLDSKTPIASRASCEGGRIGALVVIPSGAKDEHVSFRVVAGVNRSPNDCVPPTYGPGCIVARRALAFIPHTSLVVPVLMRHECEGVLCPLDQTCVKGGVCVSAQVPDPSTCSTPEGCDETVLTPPDGGAPDATNNEGGARDGGDASVAFRSKVSCGPWQACVRRADGRVFCWGLNNGGQLAREPDGGLPNGFSATPLEIPLGARALDIAVGATHACALSTSGDVLCWGDNGRLQAGQADGGAFVLTPSRVSGLAGVTDLHAGLFVSCARLIDGTIACWGDNQAAELASSLPAETAAALPVGVHGGVAQLSVGGRTLCALRDGGAVECWGSSSSGQTGDPLLRPDPAVVSTIPPARTIAVAEAHACVLSFDGRVFCWGASENSALGPSVDPDSGPHPTPVQVALPQVDVLTVGQFHSCATTADAGVLCWGDGIPGPVAQDPSVASLGDICLGLSFGCGRRADDAILCWGVNFFGQLGNGGTSTSDAAVPVALPP